jgi:cholestenol delta-isomerase
MLLCCAWRLSLLYVSSSTAFRGSGTNVYFQVFWGPGSFLTAYLISIDHPLRYSAQLIVSLGQFYGDVLYYATSLFDHYILNMSYSRPEQFYYWGYFVLMNAFWIVIPGYLMYQSVMATWSAFAAVDDAARLVEKMGNGNGKKRN